jgi:putative tryptophan/tyrosine transport system substrate-binding protein
MRRRELIKLFGGAAFAWPSTGSAQTSMPVIGILLLGPAAEPRDFGFVRELTRIGYVEGRNIKFAVRAADGVIDRLPPLARQLVAITPDIIVGSGSPVAQALGVATRDVPIVMTLMGDPVALGLSDSMSHPNRNVTGFPNSSPSLAAKRLELLRELVPVGKIGYLWAQDSPMTKARGEQARMAAKALGIELVPLPLTSDGSLPDAFDLAEKNHVAALLVESDSLMLRISSNIIDECLLRALPAMHAWPFEVPSGALIAYGPATAENDQQTASYIDRILRGAKVADLPFQEPTRIKLAISLRTARSIGIAVPPTLLIRADEVVE